MIRFGSSRQKLSQQDPGPVSWLTKHKKCFSNLIIFLNTVLWHKSHGKPYLKSIFMSNGFELSSRPFMYKTVNNLITNKSEIYFTHDLPVFLGLHDGWSHVILGAAGAGVDQLNLLWPCKFGLWFNISTSESITICFHKQCQQVLKCYLFRLKFSNTKFMFLLIFSKPLEQIVYLAPREV